MKVRDVIRTLKRHGFRRDRQSGGHRQFEGVVGGKRRLVTVPGKYGDDVTKGALSSIRRQSSLPSRSFR